MLRKLSFNQNFSLDMISLGWDLDYFYKFLKEIECCNNIIKFCCFLVCTNIPFPQLIITSSGIAIVKIYEKGMYLLA